VRIDRALFDRTFDRARADDADSMDLDRWINFYADDVDDFKRILAVLPARRRPNRSPLLRVGPAIGEPASRRRLLNTDAGVFLQGYTQRQAQQWAQRLAQELGGVVITPRGRTRQGPEIHGEGRPHFHVENPRGDRITGHIFYGEPPRGLFFDR
jgi:hypothetical protein